MYINLASHYIPSNIIPNSYFFDKNGMDDETIVRKSGIKNRRRTSANENVNTMAISAIENGLNNLPYNITEVDLIIGATYSPYDTVGTLAHVVQQKYGISGAIVFSVSSACSSFVNAIEIAEGYFAMGKAKKALIVTSEHNWAYLNESDPISAHLWGDGASAVFLSSQRVTDKDHEVLGVNTEGHATIGRGPNGVCLKPFDGGISMPDGRDVFYNAIKYMSEKTESILEKSGCKLADLNYLIPHQANMRIINKVAETLNFPIEKVVINMIEFGNTGSASSSIGYSQVFGSMQKGELAVVTVFGGGYSSGAMLVRV
ncbi:3-oxoacyl-[acyl-carrier-protein] synthase-3 [Roseivirga ehrenbergii]|uniref:3-oxoacyl-ACP synthase n=1 Tax=Roseivirga ehrenbergii (strain DSM 102268 / JCM 13514 / KCTC 12282 / NCIMB 14502 / KMM 6017) TaxID=279360 RepID=A0A150X732_ROSEK|nr:ketoacyl-ACP synthase III [Roseivirga ehrenbergii]KYG74545.1 3-oxoacyl-ACP synthase [Roseivirga ehrenbergii]TCL14141.1 3-oxoacyl-[acyl-carrier-protein] synthase-3 [Roseivirga ehrenbergii]